MSLRTILPIYRTTPLPIIYREAGVPPVKIMLEEIRLRKALRIQSLDTSHPMRKRAYGNRTTRLTKTAQLLPISADAELANLDRESPNPPNIHNSTNHDVHVYSDGAILPDGRAGGAFVLFQAERKILTSSFSIGYKVEPIDTEIIAINNGIQKALQKASTQFATNIIVFTDNQTAANIVNGKTSLTSRKEIAEIRKSQQDWKSRSRLPHTQSGDIFACWIPGHANIRGNEEADRLAKQGAQSATVGCLINKMSYAVVRKNMLSYRSKMITDWWNTHSPSRYKSLEIGIDPMGKPPKELQIERKTLGLLIAARSGHGDFKSYHDRFSHENYKSCTCGADKTPVHFFFCRLTKNKAKREIGKRRPREAINWLLGTTPGAAAFSRIMKDM